MTHPQIFYPVICRGVLIRILYHKAGLWEDPALGGAKKGRRAASPPALCRVPDFCRSIAGKLKTHISCPGARAPDGSWFRLPYLGYFHRNDAGGRLGLLGQGDGEQTVAETGFDLLHIDVVGQVERTGELELPALPAQPAVLGALLFLAFLLCGGEIENTVLEFELDIFLGKPGKLGLYEVSVVLFADIHRGGPEAGVEKVVVGEEAIDQIEGIVAVKGQVVHKAPPKRFRLSFAGRPVPHGPPFRAGPLSGVH
ncbi:hypothetical protein TRIP_E280169 [uncultured Spirochaetota bacterium]|uniref:Uncharacterized protein n=1 Tax=uncultured Spirochaetota bacterium TaxID=460511 RepID=A0A652ZWM2_9SPIR|nr:hypothetical protein TRIP_E280169 [uncultured Spirochaetota bacterium]